MRLYIEGPVNKYYVQTLCMIFFPGAKFSDEEEPSAETPALWVSLQRDAVRAEESGEPREGVTVRAKLCFRGLQGLLYRRKLGHLPLLRHRAAAAHGRRGR